MGENHWFAKEYKIKVVHIVRRMIFWGLMIFLWLISGENNWEKEDAVDATWLDFTRVARLSSDSKWHYYN